MDDHLDPDRLQSILDDGSERLKPGDYAMSQAIDQVAAVRAMRLPPAPADAHARIATQLETVFKASRKSGPWWSVGAWFGAGPFPRPMAQRLAAGALMFGAVGSGVSGATGISPLEAISAVGDFGGSIVSNLFPRGGAPFLSADLESTATTSPAASPSPTSTPTPPGSLTPAGSPPAASATQATTQAVTNSGTPSPVAGTAISGAATSATPTGATGSGASPSSTVAASGGLGTSTAASSTPPPPTTTVSAATPPATTATPSATAQKPTSTATATAQNPTSTATATATRTPTVPATPTATNSPSATVVPDQVQSYPVANAGTVTLRVSGGVLSILSIATTSGWTATVDQANPPEIDFRSGDQRFRFSAELDGGSIKTTVEAR